MAVQSGVTGVLRLGVVPSASTIRMEPQVETDSIASLHAHMKTGRWASIVPHSWVQTITPFGPATRRSTDWDTRISRS
jgi:hypothetical protein